MNFKTIAAAAALATLGSSAFAQAYVGLGASTTSACLHYTIVGDCAKDGVGEKAIFGYTLPGTEFAIEGIYNHVGAFKASQVEGRAEFKVDSVGLGGAWRPQFGAGWGGVLRAGAAYSRVRESTWGNPQTATGIMLDNYSRTTHSWQPYVGAGVTYAITPKIGLEADIDGNRIRDALTTTDVDSLGVTVGVNFAF